MAWQIKDEWIDLAQARHYVIYHNPDVLVEKELGKKVPVEHHLINMIKSDPVKMMAANTKIDHKDFKAVKANMLAALNEHHQNLMQYRAQHPNVRIGTGPIGAENQRR
jgi:hypothetical protein